MPSAVSEAIMSPGTKSKPIAGITATSASEAPGP